MSGPPNHGDYDPRRLFPFGLSPIPELPSELASEVSSVYSYYEEEESELGSEDEEEVEIRSPTSIMYSGSCASVKSNRTLDGAEAPSEDEESEDDSDTDEVDEDEDEEDDTEVEDCVVEEQKAREREEGEHYNSLVTHVMHQRAFTSTSVETEHTEEVTLNFNGYR